MAKQRDSSPYSEPPESGMGGEGPITDLSVLTPTTDAEIARGVHAALVLAPDVDADNFVVDVEAGVVRLRGRVRSAEERRQAVEAASCVHGVRQVIEQLVSHQAADG